MANTYTVIERENFGSLQAVIFSVAGTTSVSAATPADFGLTELFGVTCIGGGGILEYAGAAPSSTANLTLYAGVTASSANTLYGIAFGK